MTLSEFHPYNHSSTEPMQLLCRENDFKMFGEEKVFSCIISDLKDTGVKTDEGETLKAILISVEILVGHTL